MHRRGHGRRRPLRGLSVAFRDAIDATPARRRGGAGRSLRRSAAATRLGVARGMDSNIGQVTGVAPARRTPPGRLAISAARARPGAARAPRPALETEEYKDRQMAERSLKPPPTLPTRLALGLALLGLLPPPEVVVAVVLAAVADEVRFDQHGLELLDDFDLYCACDESQHCKSDDYLYKQHNNSTLDPVHVR